MNRRELDLRKELALAHLRIARAGLRLARERKPDALSMWFSALNLAAVLSRRDLGAWGQYARLAEGVARAILSVMRVRASSKAGADGGTVSRGTTSPSPREKRSAPTVRLRRAGGLPANQAPRAATRADSGEG